MSLKDQYINKAEKATTKKERDFYINLYSIECIRDAIKMLVYISRSSIMNKYINSETELLSLSRQKQLIQAKCEAYGLDWKTELNKAKKEEYKLDDLC
jgi:hypothetical protein